MKDVLWIAFTFPPYGGGDGMCNRKYLEHILTYNPLEGVDVLTIKPCNSFPQYDASLLDGLEQLGVSIHRVSPGPFHRLRYTCNFIRTTGSRLRAAVRKIVVFLSNTLWVLPALAWLVKKRILGGRAHYKGIYTWVDPLPSLIVGGAAKLLFRAKWVVEYGDPWGLKPATLNRSGFMRTVGRAIEGNILRITDTVITKTDAASKQYPKLYPNVPPDRFITLYGGVDLDAYEAATAMPLEEAFVICHTGLVYADSVDPEPFFSAIRKVLDDGAAVQVVLTGDKNPTVESLVAKYQLGAQVRITGHIPFPEVISYQKSSTLLLAFSFLTPYKIPSKISQYITAGRPVLLIRELEKDTAAHFVESSRRGVAVTNDSDSIKEAISRAYALWKEGSLDKDFDLRLMESLTFDYIACEIARSLGLSSWLGKSDGMTHCQP